jgi:hypothetical protein
MLKYHGMLLGNKREISNYKTAVARQWLSGSATIAQQQGNGVFCMVSAKMLYTGHISEDLVKGERFVRIEGGL